MAEVPVHVKWDGLSKNTTAYHWSPLKRVVCIKQTIMWLIIFMMEILAQPGVNFNGKSIVLFVASNKSFGSFSASHCSSIENHFSRKFPPLLIWSHQRYSRIFNIIAYRLPICWYVSVKIVVFTWKLHFVTLAYRAEYASSVIESDDRRNRVMHAPKLG